MIDKLLEVEGIEVAYGGIKALRGISFYVKKGEIVALIGANGAGKTSALRVISGMVRPSKGRVIFQGREITDLPAYKIARLGITHVPEGRQVFARLTVEENLILPTYIQRDNDKVKENFRRVLKLFPRLEERRKQIAGSLSGGEQQMLAIGRALMTGAYTMLLDEPSMGLAPIIVKEIFSTLLEISKLGYTILMVEQNANMALRLANRAYILETGKIVMSGEAEYLVSHPDVKKAYLGGK